MALNKKLTPIIAGRTIQTVEAAGAGLDITFADGSNLHIKTGGSAPGGGWVGRCVRRVRQAECLFEIDLDNDSTMAIALAEAASSVMLRDAQGRLEYAD